MPKLNTQHLRSSITQSLVVIVEIKHLEGKTSDMKKVVDDLARNVEDEEMGTSSFWVLEYLLEYKDNTVVIFNRFENEEVYRLHRESPVLLNAS